MSPETLKTPSRMAPNKYMPCSRPVHEMNVASENIHPSSWDSLSPILSFKGTFSFGEYWRQLLV